MIAAVVLVLSQVKIPEWELTLDPTPGPGATAAPTAGLSGFTGNVGSAFFDNASLRPNFVLNLVDKKAQQEAPRQDIMYYQVKAGDTVLAIAAKYGLQPETLMWSNANIEQNPDRLSIGDELRILPIDGVLHVVKPGDTLSSLANKYDAAMQAIVDYAGNGLASINDTLPVGKEIVIPGGAKPFAAPVVGLPGAYSVERPSDALAGSGNFSWPGAGYISQGYWGGHPAVDIAGWLGSPVAAADSGYVVLAGGGWNSGYGNYVIIDHGNGYTTLYAHLNSIFVSAGETVSKGQQVGTMGNTGNSTGPHLHFEIRYSGVPYNPANYLR
ncbi:MAG: M23 family metallopeptidase [Caldilineaceae bacterium]|nr:M23 family metallopeptidase [Caldilineaceae bacterium]